MKNSFFGELFNSLGARFMQATISTLNQQQFELKESKFNHKINQDKINDLKELVVIYTDFLTNRHAPAAKRHITHAATLLKKIQKKEVSNLNDEIYEIQASLNLAYVTLNSSRR